MARIKSYGQFKQPELLVGWCIYGMLAANC